MFSVNIDKLVNMTEHELKCYQETVQSIIDQKAIGIHSLGIIGGGISSFKLAYTFAEMGKKILFIDADLKEDIFLGKYRLGKSLKGVLDTTGKTELDDTYICYTNKNNMNIMFTGSTENRNQIDIGNKEIQQILQAYQSQYDMFILLSDEDGTTAKYCDASVIMMDLEQYSEISAEKRVSELDQKGCYVLGVIINE